MPQIQFIDYVVVEAEAEVHHHAPHHGDFRKMYYPWVCSRCSHLKNGALFFNDLVSGSFFLGVWVLHVDYGTLDSSGGDFVCGVQCLVRRWIHVCISTWHLDELHIISTLPWTRVLKFGLHSHAEWRRVLSRCFSFSPGCAARTRKSGDSFTSLTWLEEVMMQGEVITQLMSSC